MRGFVGVLAIAVGTALVGFSQNRWDVVVTTLPRGHGVHLNDVFGTALIALGTALVWWRVPDHDPLSYANPPSDAGLRRPIRDSNPCRRRERAVS